MATDGPSDETKESKRSDKDEDTTSDEEEWCESDDNVMLPSLIPMIYHDYSSDDEPEGE